MTKMTRSQRNKLVQVELDNLVYFSHAFSLRLLSLPIFSKIVLSTEPDLTHGMTAILFSLEYVTHLRLASTSLDTDSFNELSNETKTITLAMLQSDVSWFETWFSKVPQTLGINKEYPKEYKKYKSQINNYIFALNDFINENK